MEPPDLGVGVLRGGVPERAEEHVRAGLDDPARQDLGVGPPFPAGCCPLAAIPLRRRRCWVPLQLEEGHLLGLGLQ